MYALRKQKALSLLCVYDQTHALRDNGPGRRAERWWLPRPPPPRFRLARASLPSSDPLASKSRGDPPQVTAPATYRARQTMATPRDKKWGGMRLRTDSGPRTFDTTENNLRLLQSLANFPLRFPRSRSSECTCVSLLTGIKKRVTPRWPWGAVLPRSVARCRVGGSFPCWTG